MPDKKFFFLKPSEWIRVVVLAVVFVSGVTAAYFITKVEPRLPIINPSDLNPDVVYDSLEGQGRLHRIRDFALIDQDSLPFSQSNLEGKIYVADFFFTTCPGICKDMAKSMRTLQNEFESDSEVMFVSHSVTPKFDTPEVLKVYAVKNQAISGKWVFLTGEKKEIYDLARKSYFAVLDDKAISDVEHDFIHTENFVLIDKDKRIRGMYNGTSPEETKLLIQDIHRLKKEYKKRSRS